MNRLGNNPLGVALAGFCGLFLLASAALAYVWSLPASSGAPLAGSSSQGDDQARQRVIELGPITDYREVTERPVFDESRRPVVSVDDDQFDPEGSLEGSVAGVPEVKLSGVVITADRSFATLAPLAGGETFVATEGRYLEGEYEGWAIVDIKPRYIVLASRDGEKIQVDLMVNKRKIEEPPEPVLTAAELASVAGLAEDGTPGANGDQPLSRAEEIRQRIAERREELRREAEAQNGQAQSEAPKVSAYQSAIRNMMKRKQDNEEKEDKSNDGSDG